MCTSLKVIEADWRAVCVADRKIHHILIWHFGFSCTVLRLSC
jgi:hypothetical protein